MPLHPGGYHPDRGRDLEHFAFCSRHLLVQPLWSHRLEYLCLWDVGGGSCQVGAPSMPQAAVLFLWGTVEQTPRAGCLLPVRLVESHSLGQRVGLPICLPGERWLQPPPPIVIAHELVLNTHVHSLG